ncbi:hypothetical protein FB446DRAFT_812004 [Lentinula raphanica]|nr:hypothetical protein FB446DRAFT_812004 [Lentinula raphanica]
MKRIKGQGVPKSEITYDNVKDGSCNPLMDSPVSSASVLEGDIPDLQLDPRPHPKSKSLPLRSRTKESIVDSLKVKSKSLDLRLKHHSRTGSTQLRADSDTPQHGQWSLHVTEASGDREQANYEDTKFFLSSHRRDGTSRLAELGYACLKLNQSLGLCDPKYPCLINQDGAGFQYQSLTSLPLHAATKAHFVLKAMTESTQNYLRYRQMRFVVDSDVERLEQ